MDPKFAKGFRGDEEEMAAEDMPEESMEPSAGENAPTEGTPVIAVIAEESPVIEPTPTEGIVEPLDGQAMPPEEPPTEMNQSEKSWNGRLNARETELKAKAAELAEREASMAESSLGMPTYDESVDALTRDFGDDFVKMIQVIASGASKNEIGAPVDELRAKIDEITGNVQGAFAQVHNEMISSVHEDFEEVAQDEKFKAYVEALDEQSKAEAYTIIERGTPRQVVKLLSAFKNTLTQEGDDNQRYDSAALDAAAGVRSAGGRAPSLGGDKIAAGSEIDRFRAGFGAA